MRTNIKISIKKILGYMFLFCLIVPIVKPDGIGYLNETLSKYVWGYGQYGAGIICFCLFILHFIKNRRISGITVSVLVYIGIALAITIVRKGSLSSWYINYGNAIFICFLFEAYSEKLPLLIKTFLIYISVLLCVNLVCMIKYPNGMFRTNINYTLNWFLGYKSSMQYYIIPALTLGWINNFYARKKFIFWIVLTICVVETMLSQNMMLLVTIVFLIGVYVLRIYHNRRIFNGITYIVSGIAINLLVALGASVWIQSSFGQKFLKLIGKGSTLSGRLNIIWPRALVNIRKNFVLGNGVLSSEDHVNILGMPAAIHAHNQILEIMLCGGLILIIAFLVILIIAGIKLYWARELQVAQILGLCIFGILIMTSVEVFTRICGAGIWLIFLLAGSCECIDKQYKLIKTKKKIAIKIKVK